MSQPTLAPCHPSVTNTLGLYARKESHICNTLQHDTTHCNTHCNTRYPGKTSYSMVYMKRVTLEPNHETDHTPTLFDHTPTLFDKRIKLPIKIGPRAPFTSPPPPLGAEAKKRLPLLRACPSKCLTSSPDLITEASTEHT